MQIKRYPAIAPSKKKIASLTALSRVSFSEMLAAGTYSIKVSVLRMKQAPVASASEMKVICFDPMHLMRAVAKSEAKKKTARQAVSWIETSKDLRDLIRAKKGITNVTRRNPTISAKKARIDLLLKKAVRGI